MKLTIMGFNKKYGRDTAEPYGTFDNRRDCYRYLNTLKTGCLADTVTFFVKEG